MDFFGKDGIGVKYDFPCPNCKHEGFGKFSLDSPRETASPSFYVTGFCIECGFQFTCQFNRLSLDEINKKREELTEASQEAEEVLDLPPLDALEPFDLKDDVFIKFMMNELDEML
jgi:hypothetical protein